MAATERTRDTLLADAGLLVFRLLFGALFLYHGVFHFQKGMDWLAGFMTRVHVPAPTLTAHVVATFEVVAGVCLIVGLLTRVWGALGALTMLVTGFYVKLSEMNVGLLVPATGASAAETDFLFLAGFLLLLFAGAGAYSLDRVLGIKSRLTKLSPLLARR